MTEIKDEERFRTIDDILAFAIKKEEEAAAAYGTMIATAGTSSSLPPGKNTRPPSSIPLWR